MMERNCIGLDKGIYILSENEKPLGSTVPTLAGKLLYYYIIIICFLSCFLISI